MELLICTIMHRNISAVPTALYSMLHHPGPWLESHGYDIVRSYGAFLIEAIKAPKVL